MQRLSDVDYIVDENGCWIWQLGRSGPGGEGKQYGVKWDKEKRKQVRAHRWYYEQAKGPIPEGMDLDHLCRVRLCVNPDHLEPVSRAENLRRGPRISGATCKNGHERTEENTIMKADGSRRCRLCYNAWMREYLREKRAV
jgi:hypothetical protein